MTDADTAAETTEIETTTASVTETVDSTDYKAEAEKWQKLSRKHEDRAKANADAAKDLADLRAASMSDQEKAVDLARTEARAETLREVGSKIVDAEVRAAAAGRSVDVDALLESLDRSKFIDDAGEPDREAITAWIDRVAPVAEGQPPTFPDLGQGTRTPPALGSDPLLDSLKQMTGIR